MNYTGNYNLKKPSETDPVDINDINENMDRIDTELYKRQVSFDYPFTYLKATISSDMSLLQNETWYEIPFDVRVIDVYGSLSSDYKTITVKRSGMYDLAFAFKYFSDLQNSSVLLENSVRSNINCKVVKNGIEEICYDQKQFFFSNNRIHASSKIYLNKGEKLKVLIYRHISVDGYTAKIYSPSSEECNVGYFSMTYLGEKPTDIYFKHKLYIPTEIRKINNKYFIVDCYHHRIIYSDDVSKQYNEWNTIDYEFCKTHSIAGDTDTYVVVNTEKNELIVLDENLEFKQKISNAGSRPHHVIYYNGKFYVLMSTTTVSINVYVKNESTGLLELESENVISYINSTSANAYVRSMSIIDGYFYLPCATNGHVYKISIDDFSLVEDYTINTEYGGFNFISKIGTTWFITSTGDTNYNIVPALLKTSDLTVAPTVDTTFNMTGTPYYIEYFDDKYWIPELYSNNCIRSFEVVDGEITNVTKYAEFEPNEYDTARYNLYSV